MDGGVQWLFCPTLETVSADEELVVSGVNKDLGPKVKVKAKGRGHKAKAFKYQGPGHGQELGSQSQGQLGRQGQLWLGSQGQGQCQGFDLWKSMAIEKKIKANNDHKMMMRRMMNKILVKQENSHSYW